jgi:hypothetical protein
MAGEEPWELGLEIDLIDVAEGLLDEQDLPAVVRPVRAFAKPRKPLDVGREILVRGLPRLRGSARSDR